MDKEAEENLRRSLLDPENYPARVKAQRALRRLRGDMAALEMMFGSKYALIDALAMIILDARVNPESFPEAPENARVDPRDGTITYVIRKSTVRINTPSREPRRQTNPPGVLGLPRFSQLRRDVYDQLYVEGIIEEGEAKSITYKFLVSEDTTICQLNLQVYSPDPESFEKVLCIFPGVKVSLQFDGFTTQLVTPSKIMGPGLKSFGLGALHCAPGQTFEAIVHYDDPHPKHKLLLSLEAMISQIIE